MPQIRSPRQGRRPRLEIIPFIDIMFFLLATFMMVSLSMVHNQGIELNLPRATTASPQELSQDNLVISVDQNGQIFHNQRPTTLPQLREEFSRISSTRSQDQPRIVLQGDYQTQFGKVVEIFDAARAHGLSRLILRTEKP